MQLFCDYWLRKKIQTHFGYKYKLLATLFLLSVVLTGCAKTSILPYNHEYQAKQIQHCDLGATYVVCKNCVEYSKLNKFQNCN